MIQKRQPNLINDFTGLLKATSLLTVVGIVAFAGYHITEWWTQPVPPPTMVEIEATLFWADFRKWTLVVSAAFSGAVVIGTTFIKLSQYWEQARYIRPDRNGNMPAVPFSYSTVDAYGHKHSYRGWVDLEKMTDPGMQLHMNGTVQAETFGSADPQQQVNHAKSVTDRRHRSAENAQAQRSQFINGNAPTRGRGPNQAELKAQAGVFEAERERVQAQTQLIEQRVLSAQPTVQPVVDDEPIEWRFVDFMAAYGNYASDVNMVLGQNQTYGQIVTWDIVNTPSLRLHGSTRSGKSTLMKLIALQLCKQGHAVVVLDKTGAIDFGAFRGAAQIVDTSKPQLFMDALKTVYETEFQNRLSLIHEYTSPADPERNYVGLPDNVKAANPRMFIMMDEYSNQLDKVARDIESRYAEDIHGYVTNIASEGAKTGLHVIIGDQMAYSSGWWDGTSKGNVAGVLCGYVPNKGNAQASFDNDLPTRIADNSKWFAWNHPTADEPQGQLIKGWKIDEAIQGMYAATADNPMPVYIDLGETVVKLERQATVSESVPTGSNKLQKAMEYMIDHPEASKADVAKACNVSERTVANARKLMTETM